MIIDPKFEVILQLIAVFRLLNDKIPVLLNGWFSLQS